MHLASLFKKKKLRIAQRIVEVLKICYIFYCKCAAHALKEEYLKDKEMNVMQSMFQERRQIFQFIYGLILCLVREAILEKLRFGHEKIRNV